MLIATLLLIMFTSATPVAQAHTGFPPNACVLVKNVSYGASCFEWNGDDQWMYDGDRNGWRVGA